MHSRVFDKPERTQRAVLKHHCPNSRLIAAYGKNFGNCMLEQQHTKLCSGQQADSVLVSLTSPTIAVRADVKWRNKITLLYQRRAAHPTIQPERSPRA